MIAREGDRQLVGVLAFLDAPHLPTPPVDKVRVGRAAAVHPCVARLRGGPATLARSEPWISNHPRSLSFGELDLPACVMPG